MVDAAQFAYMAPVPGDVSDVLRRVAIDQDAKAIDAGRAKASADMAGNRPLPSRPLSDLRGP